jgi:hypothetical protein
VDVDNAQSRTYLLVSSSDAGRPRQLEVRSTVDQVTELPDPRTLGPKIRARFQTRLVNAYHPTRWPHGNCRAYQLLSTNRLTD